MKLQIDQSDAYGEVEIIIRCSTMDAPLTRLVEQIRLYGFSLHGKKDGATVLIRPEDVFYFESIDGRTFLYLEKEVYACEARLYEIEERLCRGAFVRISKAAILNMHKLAGFRAQLNGKLEARLVNGERLEVNRHYVPALKARLSEMGEWK